MCEEHQGTHSKLSWAEDGALINRADSAQGKASAPKDGAAESPAPPPALSPGMQLLELSVSLEGNEKGEEVIQNKQNFFLGKIKIYRRLVSRAN